MFLSMLWIMKHWPGRQMLFAVLLLAVLIRVVAIFQFPANSDINRKHGHLVGILSARDVLSAMARGRSSLPVAEFMTRRVVTVSAETSAREAVDLLVDNRFGALPVVGDEGELIGIVTETDFLLVSRDAFGAPRKR